MPTPNTRKLLASTAIVALVAANSTGWAQSPQAPTVAAGSIAITRQGQTTVVTQGTDKGVIDWRSFSIGPQEAVRFDQPGRSSVTLNRVTGTEQSRIDGNLSANGQVWLANPNGVMIGPGGQVNVGGLLATTGRVDAQEFLRSGRALIDQIPTNGKLVNAGSILTGDGGYAALAAAAAENRGLIQARTGTVAMGAGKAMTLDFAGDKLIQFQVTQPLDQKPDGADALVTNTGTLAAQGGTVVLSARAAKGVIDRVINMDGYAVATSITERNGVIVINGGETGRVDVNAKLLASGGLANAGGKVELQGADLSIRAAAVLDVSGAAGGGIAATGAGSVTAAGQLNASGETTGGAITIKANDLPRATPGRVSVSGKATADAARGKGGSILLDAAQVSVESGGVLTARAKESGDGGAVAMRADVALAVKGGVSVSGGVTRGSGGAARLASPGEVAISGAVLAEAIAGEGGRVIVAAGGKLSIDSAYVDVRGGRSGGSATIAGSQVIDVAGGSIDASGGLVSEIVEMTSDGRFARQMVRINADGSMQNVPLPSVGGGIIDVSGRQISLSADSAINAKGSGLGGKVALRGEQLTLSGKIDASGDQGGEIAVAAQGIVQIGALVADGATRDGGLVTVWARDSYIATLGARLQADSVSGNGGRARVIGTADGAESGAASARLFSSGTQSARSAAGRGGVVDAIGLDVMLVAASLDASGGAGGGTIRVGGDWQGSGSLAHARTLLSGGSTSLKASATRAGDGGKIVVWSNDKTSFGSLAEARGASGGAGGMVEVSSKGVLTYGGTVHAGKLLLDPKNIVIDASVATISTVGLTDPGAGGAGYGSVVSVLPNGNIVVTSPTDSAGGVTNRGAAYLFNGANGGLISALTGSSVGDQVSSGGVTVLTVSGNYLISSPNWANGAATNAGAVTWGSGVSGVSGLVAATNSLVGGQTNDQVGSGGITVLPNGNYVVKSPNWANGPAAKAGAVTWGSGATGVSGAVSAANSLVGGQTDD